MPIDPSIALNVRPVQLANPLEQFGQFQQAQAAMSRNRLAELALGQHEREASETQTANRLYKEALGTDGKLDHNKLMGSFAENGLGSRLPGLQKSLLEVDETRAKAQKEQRLAEKAQFEQARDELGFVNQIIASARDQASYTQGRQAMAARGMDVSQIPELYDPAYVDNAGRQALTQAERLEQMWKEKGYHLDVEKAAEVKRHHKAVEGLTKRGQDKADQRARDANEIAKGYKGITASTGLRKEFDDLPEVKNYKQALPAFSSIADAVTRNTTQADINIVYGIAKLYDPTSVVREGEYATVANSPNIPERIKGYAQYLANGGRLTDKVKQEILAEAKGRMRSYEQPYTDARTNYTTIAGNSGADPKLLFPSEHKSPTAEPKSATQPFADAEKERRYQEWKRSQGK